MVSALLLSVLVAHNYCPAGNISNPSTCTSHGDPVDINYGGYLLTRKDARIMGSARDLEFIRYYSSSAETWGYRIAAGAAGMPKPFGESPVGYGMNWWHNWFSFIEVDTGGRVILRQRGGRGTEWNGCSSGWLAPGAYNSEEDMKVSCPLAGGGYRVIESDGSILVYAARYSPTGATSVIFFLSSIENDNGDTVVKLHYEQPRDANNETITGCLKSDSSSWIPYLSYVQDVRTLATLRLVYEKRPVEGATQCQLAKLQHGFGKLDQNISLTTLKEFSRLSPDGGATTPLGSVYRNTGSVTELEEGYSLESFVYQTPILGCGPGVCMTTHVVKHFDVLLPDGQQHTEVWFPPDQGTSYVSNVQVVDVQNISYDIYGAGSPSYAEITSVFDDEPATIRENYVLVDSQSTHSGRLSEVVGLSGPSTAGYFDTSSYGTFDWSIVGGERVRLYVTPAGNATFNVLMGSSGSKIASSQRGADSTNSSGWPVPLSTQGNCAGLECEWFEYAAGTAGGLRLTHGYEPSVVFDNSRTETQTSYHPNGRVASVIKRGWTLDTTGNTVEQFVGTFYRLASTHGGGGCDIYNSSSENIVEEEGPCFVAGFGATACSSPGRLVQYSYPITQDQNANNGRVTYRREFPNGCTGTMLQSSYSNYTIQGKPQSYTDQSGVTTQYSYDNLGRMLSMTRGGQTWQYGYTKHNKLAFTHDPDGQYIVYCYTGDAAAGKPPTKCASSGLLHEKPVWIARAGAQDGTGWTTARVDQWQSDRLISSAFYQSDGTLEYSESFRYDGRRRLSSVRKGSGAASGRKFNTSGELMLLGSSENVPSPFCTDGSGPDPACDSMSYDRASRLTKLHQLTAAGEINTYLEYDAVGNPCEVELTESSSPDSKEGCQLDSEKTAGYQFDDFGNVVRASLQDTNNPAEDGKGVEIFSYNAAGELIARITPQQQVSRLGKYEYTRDLSGRLTAVRESKQLSPGHPYLSVSLYNYYYDTAIQPLYCPVQQKVGGRLAAVSWPGGTTYYSYNEEGQPVYELTMPPGQNCSTGGSRVDLEYTPGGRIQRMTTGDRSVFYSYIPGANADLVADVYLRFSTGSGVYSDVQILNEIEWTARGELKGYLLYLPDDLSWKHVKFTREQDGRFSKTEVVGLFTQEYSYLDPATSLATDRLMETCTSYRSSDALCQQYTYDHARRLETYASQISGGPIVDPTTTWSWDSRGNRQKFDVDTVGTIESSFDSMAWRPDRVDFETVTSGPVSPSLLSTRYDYDYSGRVSAMNWPEDSSGLGSTVDVDYTGNSSAIGDSAIRSVSVDGFVFRYVYDEAQRRRVKSFPTGDEVHYTYSPLDRTQLVYEYEDTRLDGIKTDDFYVWLGGQAVAILRGSFDEKGDRLADSAVNCGRQGELSETPCGVKYVVNDYLPKPVLALDGRGLITGVGEYSPFGEVNTRQLLQETKHPYGPDRDDLLAQWSAPSMGLRDIWRINFDVFDTESNRDKVLLLNEDDATLGEMSGPHKGHNFQNYWSGWILGESNSFSLRFKSDDKNCAPDDSKCSISDWPYTGVAVRSAEYLRYDPEAYPYFPFLRFPGQYFDAETRLHENWNRYFNPVDGAYLQVEPISRSPWWATTEAYRGSATSAYAYAQDNPISWMDSSGLFRCTNTYDCCVMNYGPEACGGAALLGGTAIAYVVVDAALNSGSSSCSIGPRATPPSPPAPKATPPPDMWGRYHAITHLDQPPPPPLPPPGDPGFPGGRPECRDKAEECRLTTECQDAWVRGVWEFRRCINKCLADAGCTPGMY